MSVAAPVESAGLYLLRGFSRRRHPVRQCVDPIIAELQAPFDHLAGVPMG